MNLTASDRSALVRLASSLPKGSEERKAILVGLKKAKLIPEREFNEIFAKYGVRAIEQKLEGYRKGMDRPRSSDLKISGKPRLLDGKASVARNASAHFLVEVPVSGTITLDAFWALDGSDDAMIDALLGSWESLSKSDRRGYVETLSSKLRKDGASGERETQSGKHWDLEKSTYVGPELGSDKLMATGMFYPLVSRRAELKTRTEDPAILAEIYQELKRLGGDSRNQQQVQNGAGQISLPEKLGRPVKLTGDFNTDFQNMSKALRKHFRDA